MEQLARPFARQFSGIVKAPQNAHVSEPTVSEFQIPGLRPGVAG
ncbi:hypothetical protein [Paraburkholderia heleia]